MSITDDSSPSPQTEPVLYGAFIGGFPSDSTEGIILF